MTVLTWLAVVGAAFAQPVFTKAQVGDRIRKVEDGVAEFRKWAENRAEKGQAAKSSGRTRGRTATDSQRAVADEKKDDLEDALGDLNRSTNRFGLINQPSFRELLRMPRDDVT